MSNIALLIFTFILQCLADQPRLYCTLKTDKVSKKKFCELNLEIKETTVMDFAIPQSFYSPPYNCPYTTTYAMARQAKSYLEWSCDGKTWKKLATNIAKKIVTSDGYRRELISINGVMPGPILIVPEGYAIKIHLANHLVNGGTTIHWHGMHQTGTPIMDGTFGITNCDLPGLGNEMTYIFKAYPHGTHMYHSHFGVQLSDGMWGALMVQKPKLFFNKKLRKQNKKLWHAITMTDWYPYSASALSQAFNKGINFKLYGIKRYLERKLSKPLRKSKAKRLKKLYLKIAKHRPIGRKTVLPFAARGNKRTKKLFGSHQQPNTATGEIAGAFPFWSILVDSHGYYDPARKGPLERYPVRVGKKITFSFIGAMVEYYLKVSIDQHPFTVVAIDGYPIAPVRADAIILNGGVRYDVEIHTNKKVANYWIRAVTLQGNRQNQGRGYIVYDGSKINTHPISKHRICTASRPCRVVGCPFKKFGKGTNPGPHHICVNHNSLKGKQKHVAGNVWISKVLKPKKKTRKVINWTLYPHGPSANGLKFRYPRAVPQMDYANGKYFHKCKHRYCTSKQKLKDCKCTHEIKLKYGEIKEFVFINMSPDAGMAHPIHIHGHHFFVMATGYYSHFDKKTGKIKKVSRKFCKKKYMTDETGKKILAGGGYYHPDITCKDCSCNHGVQLNKRVKMNERNPLRRDTVTVPFGGYVVVRIMGNNPGWWFMHCHMEIHAVEGMAVVINEAQTMNEKYIIPKQPKSIPICKSVRNPTFSVSSKITQNPLTDMEAAFTPQDAAPVGGIMEEKQDINEDVSETTVDEDMEEMVTGLIGEENIEPENEDEEMVVEMKDLPEKKKKKKKKNENENENENGNENKIENEDEDEDENEVKVESFEDVDDLDEDDEDLTTNFVESDVSFSPSGNKSYVHNGILIGCGAFGAILLIGIVQLITKNNHKNDYTRLY